MRITRLVAGLVSLLIAAALSFVGTSSTAAPAPAKEARTISISTKEYKPNRFALQGDITGSGKINYIVERKLCNQKTGANRPCKSAPWKRFEKDRTKDNGRYYERIANPPKGKNHAWYRVRTFESPKYVAATSGLIKIYVIRY